MLQLFETNTSPILKKFRSAPADSRDPSTKDLVPRIYISFRNARNLHILQRVDASLQQTADQET
jgi:hypothetical protein